VPDEPQDERSNLEKLDDLQAAHPFAYNLAVGALVGLVVVLIFSVAPVLGAAYALAYATVRWYLWQPGRVLHRQYAVRAERWAATQAERRRRHG
jgi:hypothetical protein